MLPEKGVCGVQRYAQRHMNAYQHRVLLRPHVAEREARHAGGLSRQLPQKVDAADLQVVGVNDLRLDHVAHVREACLVCGARR